MLCRPLTSRNASLVDGSLIFINISAGFVKIRVSKHKNSQIQVRGVLGSFKDISRSKFSRSLSAQRCSTVTKQQNKNRIFVKQNKITIKHNIISNYPNYWNAENKINEVKIRVKIEKKSNLLNKPNSATQSSPKVGQTRASLHKPAKQRI